ncbi:tetratricopeptide repeat protein, partial [Acinetobacter baumannii]
TGKFSDSVAAFASALKIDPDCAEAQRNLGYAQAHTSLGITFFNQGNMQKAFEEYRIALKIDPNFADAHYNLGIWFHKQGQIQSAISHFQ